MHMNGFLYMCLFAQKLMIYIFVSDQEKATPVSVALGVKQMRNSHTVEDIASAIDEVITSFSILKSQ